MNKTENAIYSPAYCAEITITEVLDRIYKTLGHDSIDIAIVDNASPDQKSI